ncbi:MAG: bifunctional acetate--CoA ligase family protein/GNAT family N-acetyltransferase [Caulobacteraceae bacterium]|nr:bifunctional acetate--CoA ligase family protein/GNAT family N-acetyltransferase [Caulobacteraceae bacterium]
MTTRNFDALFEPKSIAVIGASNQPQTVGAVLARNLFAGGFQGAIMAVNPHETAIQSTFAYRSVAELPVRPDLAVIATPPPSIPGLIAELGEKGCRAAVVVTADVDKDLSAAMLQAARPHLMRIVGPNCVGFMSPRRGINASFAHIAPKAGDIAFLSQSGAVLTSVLDWAAARQLGFSHIISLGEMSDVDLGDLLDYLAQDEATRSILLYVESVKLARKFMTAARIAARAKPVLVVKSGRGRAGGPSSGTLASADAVYDAAFRRAGMLRVFEVREVFEAAETLATRLTVRGDRLTILTNGGGVGVLAADALEAWGGRLATLAPEVVEALDACLPQTWSHANPVNILRDASGERYGAALRALLKNRGQDAILAINCPTGVVAPDEAVEAVLAAAPASRTPPILTCWLGEATANLARRRFAVAGVPSYETPDEAVRAFMHLVDYRKNQELLRETPSAGAEIDPQGRKDARAVVEHALSEGRSVLSEPEAKAVLAAYGVPVVMTLTARDPAQAAEVARSILGPVALKILAPGIIHKSDVHGVRLDLRSPEEVEAAARDMLIEVRARAPDARLLGFSVQEMITRRSARELIVGVFEDEVFGPVVMFGHGGTAVEVLGDRVLGLPPLNSVLAGEMIDRTKVAKLLAGYRDVPPAARDAIVDVLVRLADLAIELPEIAELDINPLLADDKGVLALDARVVVRPAPANAGRRLAIRPYPAELETEITLANGLRLALRPIRPQDEPSLVAMVERCTPEDIRLRFFGAMKSVPHTLAARLSQIDYDREMALLAIDPAAEAGHDIVGVVRLFADPDNISAEYAILVRSDFHGQGLGHALMEQMLAYARDRELTTVFGEVLTENRKMLDLARELGARVVSRSAPDRSVRVAFDIRSLSAPPD